MKLSGLTTPGKQPVFTTLQFILVQMTVAALVCWSGLAQATTGWAQEGVIVRPEPLSQEIGTGSSGVIKILVENVTDLYGVEFQLTFDPTVVEVVDADPVKPGGQIQPGDFLSPDWLLENEVDNNKGTIAYALSQQSPSPPRSGSGTLAIITWRGKVVGMSPIQLTHVLLGAPGGVEIRAGVEDGQIVVVSTEPVPADTLTVTAAPTSLSPTPTPTPIRIESPSGPSPTGIPKTSAPQVTAVMEASATSTTPETIAPPATVTLTGTPGATSPVPTTTPMQEAMETSLPTVTAGQLTGTAIPTAVPPTSTAMPTAVPPTSTAMSTANVHPVSTQTEAAPTPLVRTPGLPSDSPQIPGGDSTYVAFAFVLAAALGLWALWWRKQ
jgi:hypothetical protein